MTAPSPSSSVTIVTQTRIVEGQEVAFAVWQEGVSKAAAGFPGFLDQKVIPPSPPAQVDWVILQRFTSMADAQHWLQSDSRTHLLHDAQPMLAGNDDVHILPDGGNGVMPSPVSAVISTRVKPGQEDAYRAWERRISSVQAMAPGFQGYRIEPPIPGVQDSWLAIVRFDSDANLDQWMKSPERLKLVEEGKDLSDEVHARIVRTGFDQWFPSTRVGGGGPPPWKMNMLVLSLLYPVVFLLGYLVINRYPVASLHMPFWLALFVGNVGSVLLLNYLVPWASGRFSWFLQPKADQPEALAKKNLQGIAAMVALYGLAMLVFSQLP